MILVRFYLFKSVNMGIMLSEQRVFNAGRRHFAKQSDCVLTPTTVCGRTMHAPTVLCVRGGAVGRVAKRREGNE